MTDELEACKARIRELEEKTKLLHESAETFAALADRLNTRLRETSPAEVADGVRKVNRNGD